MSPRGWSYLFISCEVCLSLVKTLYDRVWVWDVNQLPARIHSWYDILRLWLQWINLQSPLIFNRWVLWGWSYLFHFSVKYACHLLKHDMTGYGFGICAYESFQQRKEQHISGSTMFVATICFFLQENEELCYIKTSLSHEKLLKLWFR